jgi:ketosteroid isomerase-like protein
MEHVNESIQLRLAAFADAINSNNRESIAGFYTQDGLFMPDSNVTMSKQMLLNSISQRYFKKLKFHIAYSIKGITVDDKFAFAHASALATTTDLLTGQESARSTRDFFILRKESDQWMIYRYIFNAER